MSSVITVPGVETWLLPYLVEVIYMKYVIVLSYFIQGVLLGAILILAVMGLFSLTELVSLLGV